MTHPTITLRDATAADVDGIVAVFLECWTVSYAAVMPASLVGAMTQERALSLWAGVLANASASQVIVAEQTVAGRGIVGVTRWAIDAKAGGAQLGTVHSLYVAPAAQGGGIGAVLLAAATERMATAGVATARLWVFRDNASSIAFYRRSGWLPDGGTRVQPEFGEPEIRLAKEFDRR